MQIERELFDHIENLERKYDQAEVNPVLLRQPRLEALQIEIIKQQIEMMPAQVAVEMEQSTEDLDNDFQSSMRCDLRKILPIKFTTRFEKYLN